MNLRSILPWKNAEHDDEDENRNLDRYRGGGKKIDFVDCKVLEREPEVASGAWLFKGTPIGLDSVLCELAQNKNLDETVEQFHGLVEREAIQEALYHMAQKLATAKL